VESVDSRNEVREFLATRRAKLTPQQAGVPLFGGRRRVPGLRREEVALLAGVSTDYYTRLEKGHVTGVSDEVLYAVARALQLDEAERAHLLDLVRAARPARQPRRRPRTRIRPSLQRVLDALTNAPAIVRNGRMDILASNPLGRALYSPVFDDPAYGGNIARFQFLDPAARDFHPNWDLAADTTVAIMRTEAGRDPHNRDLTDLVGELATKSEQFRVRWAGHNVRLHYTGAKTFRHPVVGVVELSFEAVDLPTDDLWGLNLTIYTPEAATPAEDRIKLLASWAASEDTESSNRTANHDGTRMYR
jgi:transcriptional regulator with XRE-family HTH domain